MASVARVCRLRAFPLPPKPGCSRVWPFMIGPNRKHPTWTRERVTEYAAPMISISRNRRVRQEPGRGCGLGEEGAATVLGFLAAAGFGAAGLGGCGVVLAAARGGAAPDAVDGGAARA